jgi:hypothetical protein
MLKDVTKTVECHHLDSLRFGRVDTDAVQPRVVVSSVRTGPTIGMLVVGGDEISGRANWRRE